MMNVWFDTLRTYSSEMLAKMELAIGDDHGDPKQDIPKDIQALLPCQLFRSLDDILWNQPGMRNLLLEHIRTPLVLFVDPDMVFEADMMRRMLEAGTALERGQVIRFMLRHRGGHAKGVIDPSSPNTWFMHRDDFDQVGAYDEDFAGNKGWSDVQMLDVMKANYKIHHRQDLFAEFYGTDEVPDAMVSSLDRSTKANKHKRLLKVKQSRMMGGWAKWTKNVAKQHTRLRFRWERVL